MMMKYITKMSIRKMPILTLYIITIIYLVPDQSTSIMIPLTTGIMNLVSISHILTTGRIGEHTITHIMFIIHILTGIIHPSGTIRHLTGLLLLVTK